MTRINEPVEDFLKGVKFSRGSGKSSSRAAWVLYNIWLRTDTDLSFKEWFDSIYGEYLTDGEMKKAFSVN